MTIEVDFEATAFEVTNAAHQPNKNTRPFRTSLLSELTRFSAFAFLAIIIIIVVVIICVATVFIAVAMKLVQLSVGHFAEKVSPHLICHPSAIRQPFVTSAPPL